MLWLKAGVVGLLATYVEYMLTNFLMLTGVAPYNTLPLAVMLERWGISSPTLVVLLYMLNGVAISIATVHFLGRKADTPHTTGVMLGLWLVSMFLFYPLAGWGFFGQGPAFRLPPTDPLYLESGLKVILASLCLHLIWGTIMGYLNRHWTYRRYWSP